MRKTLLVPVHSLAEPSQSRFLEFYIEPVSTGIRDFFDPLVGMGLEIAIDSARQAQKLMPLATVATAIYPAHRIFALSDANGIALGFALSRYMFENNCPYELLIAAGILNLKGTPIQQTEISGSVLTQHTLHAILALGKQTNATVLILPLNEAIDVEEKSLLNKIEQLNIDVRCVKTLSDALCACLSGSAFRNSNL